MPGSNWFSKYVVPRVKFLREITEQVYCLTVLNDEMLRKHEEYMENSFAFMCPNCSGLMRIDRKDPTYDYCNYCGKGYMELFFGAQRIFKVDDGCVTWWVSAASEEEAVQEVIKYEQAAGCDLIKEAYWEGYDLEDMAYDISPYDAIHTTFHYDTYKKSTMWDEFLRDNSTRVLACSEW